MEVGPDLLLTPTSAPPHPMSRVIGAATTSDRSHRIPVQPLPSSRSLHHARRGVRVHAPKYCQAPARSGLSFHPPPVCAAVAASRGAVEGLLEGVEPTSDLQPDKVGLLKKAMDVLVDPLAAFLAAGRRRNSIVHDFCYHCVPAIVDQHKVASSTFLIFHDTFLVFVRPRWANTAHPRTEPQHFVEPPKWIPFLSTTFVLCHET
ncbi:hypothetical protein ZWY2020_025003 [Hordeum vulgare]|nr:hypothetical protein ZWY2020_025003 [Hordeum vulgare]